jgi:uncharacterized membrane protein YcaP (DUF421 family)
VNEGLVVVVRAIISFFSLLIFAKILGKEQISQLTFFDYILGITIGSIASEATVDLSSRIWPHFVGLLSWSALAYLMQYISLKWRYAAKIIEGEPVIVIMNGKIMDNVLRKMKFRVSDVLELLRNQGIFDLNEVDYAILEPNGSLSVLKKPEYLPLTPKDMNIEVKPTGISTEIVYDGKLMEQNLRQMNKDKKWLMNQLKKYGIKDVSEALLVTLNDAGSLYVDKYNDNIKKVKDIGDYKGPY